jgi:hypothetical protein
MGRAMRKVIVAGAAALALAGAVGVATAGEIQLSWRASLDDVTAGYEVEVLTEGGNVVQVIDVEEALAVTVGELADGQLYRFRVRPYDRFGNRAERASRELVSYAAPRIDALEPLAPADDGSMRAVAVGNNFHDEARFLSRRDDVTVRGAAVESPQRAVLVLDAATATAPLAPGDLLPVNPVRKSAAYFDAHPEVLDVDGSRAIDARDLDLVRAAFGAQRGEPGYDAARDINDDGIVDGEDEAALRAVFAERKPDDAENVLEPGGGNAGIPGADEDSLGN